jgi:hypothetical protein
MCKEPNVVIREIFLMTLKFFRNFFRQKLVWAWSYVMGHMALTKRQRRWKRSDECRWLMTIILVQYLNLEDSLGEHRGKFVESFGAWYKYASHGTHRLPLFTMEHDKGTNKQRDRL